MEEKQKQKEDLNLKTAILKELPWLKILVIVDKSLINPKTLREGRSRKFAWLCEWRKDKEEQKPWDCNDPQGVEKKLEKL